MAHGLKEITRQALQLPSDDRINLAEQLLESVGGFASNELEDHWRTIAVQRLEEHQQGEVAGIPADQVHRKLEARLREGHLPPGSKR